MGSKTIAQCTVRSALRCLHTSSIATRQPIIGQASTDRQQNRRRFASSAQQGNNSTTSGATKIPATYPMYKKNSVRTQSTADSGALPDIQVDHLVVGGGVVGLAITYALAQQFPDKTTYLVERHERPGEETSSRNSEVIHAGLYYPADSLKTNLCLRGRELMYEFCQAHNVPHRQTGKLVVGTHASRDYLKGIVRHVDSLNNVDGNLCALITGDRTSPPLRIIDGDEARSLEPNLGKEVGWTLESARTGIVDSHEFMAALERLTLDSECAEIVYDTAVVGVKPVNHAAPTTNNKRGSGEILQGWIVETQTDNSEEVDTLLARHVINASGLNGPAMLNTLIRDGHFGSAASTDDMIGMWFSKGNYASYSKAKGGVSDVKRLIYPLPDMGGSSEKHGHQSLGTHLTLDLNGNIRFGPDTDWLCPPSSHDPQTLGADWWKDHLVALQPSSATQVKLSEEERLDEMHASVTSFLPGVERAGLSADYAGVRPKLVGPGGGFADFTIYYHSARQLDRQPVRQLAFDAASARHAHKADQRRNALYTGAYADQAEPSLVSLCGIESPGLTSSLAIAEVVANLIARRGWGVKMNEDAVTTRSKPMTIPKGAQNEDAGHVDQWA